jgi:hypothetical protein
VKKTPAIEPGSGERNKRPDKSSPDTALDLQHQALMLPQRGLVTVLDGAERDIPNGHLRTVVDDGLSQLNPLVVPEIVRLGREAMARKRRAYDDWLAIAEALEVGRTDVMRALHTNQAHGRRYEKAMGEWRIAHGFKEINKSTRSRLLECLKHKVGIQAWRSRLTDAERFAFAAQ